MSVKVIIVRRVPPEKILQLKPLVVELRSRAMAQPGYISGETLLSVDDASECLVISTWSSLESWNTWLADERRRAVQQKVDELLGCCTYYQVYTHADASQPPHVTTV